MPPSIAPRRAADRMAEIAPFQVMEIQRRALELDALGRRVIHMAIGQPDFSAPPPVLEAASRAMNERALGFTGALGIPELREAIAKFYLDRYRITVPADRIVVTAGASGAFLVAMGILVNPGDVVLMPDPCYPCNRNFVRMFSGVPVSVPVTGQQQYQLTVDEVESNWTKQTRGVIVASPSNPTGTLIETDQLKRIAAKVASRGGFLIVDEIYHGLTYGSTPSTALAIADEAFVINSFSKYFSMTGWRLGWMVAPAWACGEIERLSQNAFICPPAPSQYAALACFQPETIEILEKRREEFRLRRDFLIPELRKLGFDIPVVPDGAFYVYADCSTLSPDSNRFAWELLEHAGVAITPGLDFGSNRPERHVRFAYTRAMADLEEGISRIAQFLGR